MRIVKYDIENFKGIACMTDFNKRLEFYEDIGKILNITAMDWLQFSPVSDKNMQRMKFGLMKLSENEITRKKKKKSTNYR